MIDFAYHKAQAERLLKEEKYLPTSTRQCMHIIVSLCEKGESLEADENIWRERVQMRQELIEQYEKDIADLKNELRRVGERY